MLKMPAAAMTETESVKKEQQRVEKPAAASRRTPDDFIFGKMIGEGSFSTVFLAKDIHTHKEFAIKVCEKQHIVREKKVESIKREKDILYLLSGTPFIVRLFFTFQDDDRLYFVLSYAKNGELLPHIRKVGSLDAQCTRFYSSEILIALEHMHRLNIVHRDLKPENILLDENMHILITDFGSAKIISPIQQGNKKKKDKEDGHKEKPMMNEEEEEEEEDSSSDREEEERRGRRRGSFVGTAQYVSPELLLDQAVTTASDLWAFGCIVYQMISGLPPFRSRSEYMIFQKITKLEYEFPDGFCAAAKDLVQKLLVLEPEDRLGSKDGYKYYSIRRHPFYRGIDFEKLRQTTPPPIYPYLPGTSSENHDLRSQYRVPDHLEPGLNDKQLTRLLGLMEIGSATQPTVQVVPRRRRKSGVMDLTPEEVQRRLEKQRCENPWNNIVEGNLILKQGLVDKRKGLFSRRRMLLLTMGPHLYYADPSNYTLKGEIPWSAELRVEPKNFKIFFVHTPNRTYYLEDPEGYALEWCKVIEEVRMHMYASSPHSPT